MAEEPLRTLSPQMSEDCKYIGDGLVSIISCSNPLIHCFSVMSVFSLAMLLAPVLGPVAGGFLSEAADWRWIFWLLTIMVC